MYYHWLYCKLESSLPLPPPTDIYAQHSNLWNKGESEFGVFTIGELHHAMKRDLWRACKSCSKPSQLTYRQHHITT